MRLAELVSVLPEADAAGGGPVEISGIEHDSRRIGPGGLFVCIQGLRQDGHAFIPQAVERGAAALVVDASRTDLAIPAGTPTIRVRDPRAALARLAAQFYGQPSRDLRMVGVTGTNGKTTTAYLVEAILRGAGRPCGLLGTIEYRCGERTFPGERTTPEASDLFRLLAAMRDLGAWGAAMEVSSHSLVLHRVDACEFDVGIFTNLTQDHLDFHGTMEAYAEAKGRLFAALGRDRAKPGEAAAILNGDDPWAEAMAARTTARVVRFGLGPGAEIRPRELRLHLDGIRATVESPWGEFEIRSPLVGRHNVSNILGAAGACLHLGLSPDEVGRGIAGLAAVPGRFEKVEAGQPFGVVVDYAHTPDALDHVLTVAQEFTPGRVIVVFGCGGDRDRGKRPIMGQVAARLADQIFVTSDNPRSEEPEAILEEIVVGIKKAPTGSGVHAKIPDRREAIGAALACARGGDLVVIAGKGHETYQVLRSCTIPFDDRIVAHEALAALGYRAP